MVRVCLYGRAGAGGQAVEGSGECWKEAAAAITATGCGTGKWKIQPKLIPGVPIWQSRVRAKVEEMCAQSGMPIQPGRG